MEFRAISADAHKRALRNGGSDMTKYTHQPHGPHVAAAGVSKGKKTCLAPHASNHPGHARPCLGVTSWRRGRCFSWHHALCVRPRATCRLAAALQARTTAPLEPWLPWVRMRHHSAQECHKPAAVHPYTLSRGAGHSREDAPHKRPMHAPKRSLRVRRKRGQTSDHRTTHHQAHKQQLVRYWYTHAGERQC
jgi:hypothetical protein